MGSLLKLLLVATLIALSSQACVINPNNLDKIATEPVLLKSTENGQKLILGNVEDMDARDYIYIANLKGTPYQMGKAFGELFKEELGDLLTEFYTYYGELFQQAIEKKLPAFLAPIISKNSIKLLKNALLLNVLITKKYTNPRYYEELKGISDGAKIPEKDVSAINMLPQLVKAACTVAGIWGNASADGRTLHMRALDWDYNNPINKYPLITVYHPSNEKWQTNANVGWVGLIGSLTGISKKVSLGEKVWINPKNSVQMTRYGNPWTYVFRDILYDAVDLSSAIEILSTTRRTCAIHIGLGSVEDHSFRMILYAEKRLDIFDDKNYTYTKVHQQKDGIAYFDKHVQPSGDTCLGSILTNDAYYGKWDMESFWRIVGNSHQTGNTQLVVFDLEQLKGLISYSKYKANIKAFVRRPIEVDFNELFKPF